MNVDEARQLLGCRRPCGKDDDLPEMKQALAKLESIPDYMTEIRQERELDEWLAGKLKAVEPPAALRERLLSRAAPRPPRPVYLHPFLWTVGAAVAAAVALLLMSRSGNELPDPGPVPVRPQITLRTEFRNDALGVLTSIVEGKASLDKEMPSVPAVMQYLKDTSPSVTVPTPGGLADLPKAIGCKVFQWRGRRVTLVCMHAGTGSVHLFTIDAAELPDELAGVEPCCCKPWNTLMWRTDGKIQLLASIDLPPEEMQKLIAKS